MALKGHFCGSIQHDLIFIFRLPRPCLGHSQTSWPAPFSSLNRPILWNRLTSNVELSFIWYFIQQPWFSRKHCSFIKAYSFFKSVEFSVDYAMLSTKSLQSRQAFSLPWPLYLVWNWSTHISNLSQTLCDMRSLWTLMISQHVLIEDVQRPFQLLQSLPFTLIALVKLLI